MEITKRAAQWSAPQAVSKAWHLGQVETSDSHCANTRRNVVKKLLSILPILLSLGCYTPDQRPSEHAQPLDVNPIADLPSYEGGRVLHPWHFRALPKDRFPAVATGNATDSQCFLADSYYRKCLILQCDENLDCDPGARCVDVALAFDPDGSTEGVTPSGATIWTTPSGTVYPVLHLAVCLKK